jgi:hypothetical protein
MEAVLTGRLDAPLRIFSGNPSAVATAVANLLIEHSDADHLRLDVKDSDPAFCGLVAETTRLLLESRCIEPYDATDPEEWQLHVQIAEDLGPAWATHDRAKGHLTIWLWSSQSTMHWLNFDTTDLRVAPREIWCQVSSWHPDVGGVDHQLGVLVDHVMYRSHQDPESFQLVLQRLPDDAEIARSIIESLASPPGISRFIAALYVLGLPCDGSLGEDEFRTLGSIDDDLRWMTRMTIVPPPGVVEQVRSGLTERNTGAVRVLLKSLKSTRSKDAKDWDETIDWTQLLLDQRKRDRA